MFRPARTSSRRSPSAVRSHVPHGGAVRLAAMLVILVAAGAQEKPGARSPPPLPPDGR